MSEGKENSSERSREEHWLDFKWRPALWMVVFGAVILVAMVPIGGMVVLLAAERILGWSFELRSLSGMLTLAAGSAAMAFAIGGVFLRTLLRPVEELIGRTGEIERGDANAYRPLQQGGTRELALLGERFFRLAKRLSDRSDYLTLFTTHVSHELKTPLTSILGAAELLRESGSTMQESQRRRFLHNITQDAARLAALSTRLRELAHAEVADTAGQCAIVPVISQTASEAMLQLDVEGMENATVLMSASNAAMVWQQLCDNASQNGAGKLVVRGEQHGAMLVLHLGDDGRSISKLNRAKIFDPFFTTRREQGGTGMGLGIAKAMLKSHGGDIHLSDQPDAKFVLMLPLVPR